MVVTENGRRSGIPVSLRYSFNGRQFIVSSHVKPDFVASTFCYFENLYKGGEFCCFNSIVIKVSQSSSHHC